MKILLVFFGLVFISVDCFKIDADSYYIPSRFILKRERADYQLPDVLYPSNRQGSLYDETDNLDSFQKALEALAQASASNNKIQEDSTEDDVEPQNINDLLGLSDNKYDNDEIKADPRDEESESHSSLGAGHQYVSGGAGEGKQHLKPDGHVPNVEEVKSDEDLPAYCDPPNPCPVGYVGEDCDPRSYHEYTAEFSKAYQEHQNCMCDDDHNECPRSPSKVKLDKLGDLIRNMQSNKQEDKFLSVVAKKSPRVRREAKQLVNPYLRGEAIKIHVAKKSAPLQ